MFWNNGEGEAALYYLYMMSDGEVSENEKKIFHTICRELNVSKDEKKGVIAKCTELAGNKTNIFDVIVGEKIDEQAGEEWGELRDASSLARIIWNLVNLGYADSVYSDEEKKIVNYLVERWSVNTEVYQEFIDTADTMLALVKQKEWIVSTLPEDDVRVKKEKKIGSELKKLLSDVKLTIEELTM